MKKALVVSIVAIALVIPAFAVFSPSSEQPVAAPQQVLRAVVATGPAYKEGELLVRLKEDTGPDASSQVQAMAGARSVSNLGFGTYLVKLPSGMSLPEVMSIYADDPGVIEVSPNYTRKVQQIYPQDALFNYQWALNNTGQTGSDSTFDADIDAPEAWTVTTGSQDVVVAIIDTGVDYTHPDLAANMWVNTQEIPGNGIDDDNNGYIDDVHGINAITGSGDPMDDNGHGTHVAGIIGAVGNNQIGVAGVNWNVRIMALKFLDSDGFGSTADSLACFNYIAMMADRGVNIVVVNGSYGGIRPAFTFEGNAISQLRDRGILFIAAAGNFALDNDGLPMYPAGYNIPNLIAVAATDAKDRLASFANFGSQRVHLGAPGVNIYSTLLGGTYGPLLTGYSGTSMAAPHVTGAVALLYSTPPPTGFSNPVLDWPFVRNRIFAGGDLDQYLVGKTATGRRLNLNGSFNCSNREILARLTPATSETITFIDPSDGTIYYWVIPKRKEITAIYGKDAFGHFFSNPVKISAVHIDCDDPAGTVSATIGSDRIALADDGVAPDAVAGDGVYSAYWYPPFDTKDVTAKINNRGTSSSSYTDSFTVRVRQTDAVRGDFVADAGKNISVGQGQTALLDGSVSSGPLDIFQPLAYTWEQTGGAEITWGTYTVDLDSGGTKVLASEITSRPFFTTPNYVNPVQGQPDPNILTFKLTVEKLDENGEPSGLTATDTVKVTVKQNTDGGGGGGGSSCFIATAAYGSNDLRHLPILRQFRDQYLLTNPPGRFFVRLYYHFSPPLASFIAKHNGLRALVRVALLPLFVIAELTLATSAAQKLFVIASLLLVVGLVLMLRREKRQEN